MASTLNTLGSALALMTTLACLGALAFEYHRATDFPGNDPVRRVDQELVEHLRANPGLHLALDPAYRLEVTLELEEDSWNQRFFGTEVDLREVRPRQAIHIQRKGRRAAIHTDDFNPKAGAGSWLLHNSLDVPVLPLSAGWMLGLFVFLRLRRRARRDVQEM